MPSFLFPYKYIIITHSYLTINSFFQVEYEIFSLSKTILKRLTFQKKVQKSIEL